MPSRQPYILGDSLGATVEFQPWDEIRRHYPEGVRDITGGGPFHWNPGHATDDTDMTRAVLLAYADKQQAKPGEAAAGLDASLALAQAAGNHMLDWLDGRWPDRREGTQPADVGGATRTGLAAFRKSRDARCAGAGDGQAGNGSLMRCIPTALFAADPAALLQESALVSAITHDDRSCVLACAAYNAMAHALAVQGASPADAVAAGLAVVQDKAALKTMAASLAVQQSPAHGVTAGQVVAHCMLHRPAVVEAVERGKKLRVGDVARLGPKDTPGARDAIPHAASGYVLESLTLAVAAVLDERALEDVLVDVVRIGRDTDTNGAIAGGLLGARDGVEAIPARWRDKLQFAAEFTEIVEKLVKSG